MGKCLMEVLRRGLYAHAPASFVCPLQATMTLMTTMSLHAWQPFRYMQWSDDIMTYPGVSFQAEAACSMKASTHKTRSITIYGA